MKPFKVGLVLGGGGARGLAHVGVISVLEKAGIPINIISGTSVGSIVGGVYAQTADSNILRKKITGFIKGPKFSELGVNNFKQKTQKDPDDILKQLAQQVKRRVIINLAANRIALLKSDRLEIAIDELLNDTLIEDCKIPFACVAADLVSGEEVMFYTGKIRPAVQGSSAIPGFIPPVEYNSHTLVDGSVVNNFPIEAVKKLGADVIILINVSLDFENNIQVDNVIDLVMRTSQITMRKLNKLLLEQADLIISPNIGNVHWSEFNRIDELIKLGEKAAKESLPKINKIIKKRKNILHRLFH